MMPLFLLATPQRTNFFSVEGHGATSHGQHLEIFAAIEAQDKDRAVELTAKHIGRVERYHRK